MTESAMLLGRTVGLVGVITVPDVLDPARPALLIFNAGTMMHTGPNRWSVRMARALAQHGYVVVRFDHSGIGDSDTRGDALAFAESAPQEAREVMDTLQARHGVTQFALLGLCSGASTAFLTAQSDPRVSAAFLLNPPGVGSGEEAEEFAVTASHANRYWSVSLLDPNAWWRAITGRIQYRRLWSVLTKQIMLRIRPPAHLPTQLENTARALSDVATRGTQLFFVFSARDEGKPSVERLLSEPVLRPMFAAGRISQRTISGTDHTYSLQCNQEVLIATVRELLDGVSIKQPAAEALTR